MRNDLVFTQLKKCNVLLGLLLPFHQEAYAHSGLRLLLTGGEFSPQNRGALLQAVFVHTAEYLISRT